MNPSKITAIFLIILFGIVIVYRISRILSGSAPRRTKMITVIGVVIGIIVALVWVGLQTFHVIR